MPDEPVDFVVSWVSGDDREWLRARLMALGHTDPDQFDECDVRYRDWGLLRFWFRAIEENAPWARTVHLVTDTRIPAWLNTAHPNLRVVKTSSLSPERLLTFNSHAMEASLDRIPGLAERFVYMNDDFFLTAPLTPEFFFPDGRPYADPMPMLLTDGDVHAHGVLNASGVVNEHFTLNDYRGATAARAPRRRTLRRMERAFGHAHAGRIPPATDHHLATPLLKSVTCQAFNAAGAALETTRRSIFRSREDIAPIALATHWHVAVGAFSWVPRKRLGRYLEIGKDPLQEIAAVLQSRAVPQVCVNDGVVADPDRVRAQVLAMFMRRWPEPSSFEVPDNEAAIRQPVEFPPSMTDEARPDWHPDVTGA